VTSEKSGWLEGYVALVTGGGSGLGRAVAERYVAEGASVVIVGHDAVQLEATIAAQPDAVRATRWSSYVADVRDTDALHAAVGHTVGHFGKLDVAVANAGIWDFQRQLTRLSGKEIGDLFDELVAINVKGYLLTAEAAWRELVKTRGSLIMTLSNASFYVNGGGPVYTAAKHASLGLMRELAYELAPSVRVNGVAPGGMNTDLRGPAAVGLQERSIGASFAKNAASKAVIPLHGSPVDPTAFTGPYVLLAARDQSSTITGEVISADGGIGVRGFATAAGGEHLRDQVLEEQQ
jgi:2,3-dihydroxy-2,3-dihydrophenylpropionate dehydrogenase